MTDRQVALAQSALTRARSLWAVDTAMGLMTIETQRRRTTVLLGTSAFAGEGLAVIDWRTAPLAEVFFGLGEGDTWEGPGGVVKLVEKFAFVARAGIVDRVLELPRSSWPRRAGATPGGFRSPLDVTLDPAQQRVVDLPASRHALVLGEAGFGKTTVALRRLEALARAAGPDFRGAVVVPTEGLRRLTRHVLERRKLDQLEVWTFDAWARHEAQRAFRLPSRESTGASSRTITLKRHVALGAVVKAFAKKRAKGQTTRRDLLHLFGDTAWLDQVVQGSQSLGAPLHSATVAEVAEHTHVQFLETTEQQFAGVTDASRLAAVDGARLDAGTPDEDAHSIDPEDYPVLFALEAERAQLNHQAPRKLSSRWDALVIDEAQELAPLELQLLARALKPTGALVVAGDAAQQVDDTTTFLGWDATMASLGARDFDRTTLAVNYRCPPEVTTLARRVLDNQPDEGVVTDQLLRLVVPHAAQHLLALITQLREYTTADTSASVAVICRSAEAARSLARQLGHGLSLHLALDGDFKFRPGLVVTSVAEVKGLEFDAVIVPDAAGAAFTSTPEARRALYVAVTRATHLLVLTKIEP
jgi:hypothetical protein